MKDFAARLEGTGEFVDGQALSPDGHVGPLRRRGAAAGDRRPVRRDQGPDRRVDGHRRRQPASGPSSWPASCRRPRGRAAGRSTSGSRSAPSSTGPAHRHRVTGGRRRAAPASCPRVLGVLVRRGADFATAEDAVQEALIRALSAWGDERGRRIPTAWLITVAWRAFLDMARSDAARRDREERVRRRAAAGGGARHRRHAAALLPVRAPRPVAVVGGRADPAGRGRAHHPPDRRRPTSCPRRPWPSASAGPSAPSPGPGVERPGDVRTVMRVLYLVFNEGYSGDVDLAAEAIRLTRQLAALGRRPRGARAARPDAAAPRPPPPAAPRPDGGIVPLAEQDRSRVGHRARSPRASPSCRPPWPATGSASTRPRRRSPPSTPTPPRVEETDWVQIVEWYDELLRFADTPIVRLNRAVAVGEADGAPAGLAALAEVDERRPPARRGRRPPPRAERRPRARRPPLRDAARHAPNLAERDHQMRQAARLNQRLRQDR